MFATMASVKNFDEFVDHAMSAHRVIVGPTASRSSSSVSSCSLCAVCRYSDFKFMVAAGVLAWLYVMFLMIVYIFRARIEQWCTFLPPIELVLDGVFVVFCLAAGASSADRCNHRISGLDGTPYEGETICKNSFIKTSDKVRHEAQHARWDPSAARTSVCFPACLQSLTARPLLLFLICSLQNNLNASIVFAFFSMVAFMVSFFFSWRDNANEESKR